jgi:hypothetical protein
VSIRKYHLVHHLCVPSRSRVTFQLAIYCDAPWYKVPTYDT